MIQIVHLLARLIVQCLSCLFWIHSQPHLPFGHSLTVLTILVYFVLAPNPRPATPASQTSFKGSKKKTPTKSPKSSKISPQASTSQSSTENENISKKCGTKLSQLSASPARFVIDYSQSSISNLFGSAQNRDFYHLNTRHKIVQIWNVSGLFWQINISTGRNQLLVFRCTNVHLWRNTCSLFKRAVIF